jgi:ATP-dependent exoDNAse (exonuclease V) alpha subunit
MITTVRQLLKPKSDKWKDHEDMVEKEDAVSPETRFHAAAAEGRNIFLTGMAGTGKSHLLREWIAIRDHLTEGQDIVHVTAPTGIAALNVGGMTINRWAGMFLGPPYGMSFKTFMSENYPPALAYERIKNANVLVIDEISMMTGRNFDYLNFLCQRLRDRTDPFGGIQVIVIGDFMQLPPVSTEQERTYDWAFKSEAWDEAGFVPICLEKVHRQSDREFITALAGARMAELRGKAWEVFRGCVTMNPPDNVVRLYSRNSMVDRWNDMMLNDLSGNHYEFVSKKLGNCKAILDAMRSPDVLQLKVGAAVMITKNLDDKTPNGMLGKVTRIETGSGMNEGLIEVELSDGRVICPKRHKWEFRSASEWNSDFSDATGERVTQSCVTQFPLRLAYAMTIHKAQGMTLDAAYMDVNSTIDPGQAYVALSRVKTRAGLMLKDWPKGIWVSSEAKAFYKGITPNE